MAFSNANKANLRFVTSVVTCNVTNSFASDLGHQNNLGRPSKAPLDPSLIEQITFGPVKVRIKIETSVPVSCPRNCTQCSQVLFPGRSHRDIPRDTRQLDERSLQRYTHVGQKEFISFGQARGLRIVGISKQVEALNAARGAPSQHFIQC
ncbi:MAG: hypothetical protein ABSF28_08140 [Terracidiphilus sp.]|jgi:hypothetical protein